MTKPAGEQPVFPHVVTEGRGYDEPGLTLRDYLAAQELIAMGDWVPQFGLAEALAPDAVHKRCRVRAIRAYTQADEMLAVREMKELPK